MLNYWQEMLSLHRDIWEDGEELFPWGTACKNFFFEGEESPLLVGADQGTTVFSPSVGAEGERTLVSDLDEVWQEGIQLQQDSPLLQLSPLFSSVGVKGERASSQEVTEDNVLLSGSGDGSYGLESTVEGATSSPLLGQKESPLLFDLWQSSPLLETVEAVMVSSGTQKNQGWTAGDVSVSGMESVTEGAKVVLHPLGDFSTVSVLPQLGELSETRESMNFLGTTAVDMWKRDFLGDDSGVAQGAVIQSQGASVLPLGSVDSEMVESTALLRAGTGVLPSSTGDSSENLWKRDTSSWMDRVFQENQKTIDSGLGEMVSPVGEEVLPLGGSLSWMREGLSFVGAGLSGTTGWTEGAVGSLVQVQGTVGEKDSTAQGIVDLLWGSESSRLSSGGTLLGQWQEASHMRQQVQEQRGVFRPREGTTEGGSLGGASSSATGVSALTLRDFDRAVERDARRYNGFI